MSTVAYSPRVSDPIIASAGQTDFEAGFPPPAPVSGVYSGIYVSRLRAPAEVPDILTVGTDFSLINIQTNTFSVRLNIAQQAGDVVRVFGKGRESRSSTYVTGRLDSDALEAEFVRQSMRLQEHARDIDRAMVSPLGEAGVHLPAAAVRANKLLGFGADGKPSATRSLDAFDADVSATAAASQASIDAKNISVDAAGASIDARDVTLGARDSAIEEAGAAAASAASIENLLAGSIAVKIVFASRAEAQGAIIPLAINEISVLTGGVKLQYVRDAAGTALTSIGGQTWSPGIEVYPDHFATNTSPGITDMTAAYQAAHDYAAGGFVRGLPGAVYGISAMLQLKSRTAWAQGSSRMVAIAPASATFFALWQPENGAHGFRVTGGELDCNDQPGMIGFILRVGTHDGIVDGAVIKNYRHDKDGVDGGRGFVIESLATVLDNSNLIVTNIICRSGYMGFACRAGDAIGLRHNVIISNITIEDSDTMFCIFGNTTGYPFTADKSQILIDNVIGKNCGKQNIYTNGGGAIVNDRACNIKMTNIVLANDAAYGAIPCVWHGNGAYNQADITYHGDCTNFWDFRAYKEADGGNPTENTVQNSHFRAMHFGTCTDVAYIGSATGSYTIDVHISGVHQQVSSGAAVSANLRQADVWVDLFDVTNNARICGRGDIVGAALFNTYAGAIARLGPAYFGNSGVPTYAPTTYTRDTSTDMTGGHEIASFNPSLKFRDLSGASYTGALFQDGTVFKLGFDTTPTAAATWSYKYGWSVSGFTPLTDDDVSLGDSTHRWRYVMSKIVALFAAAVPSTIAGMTQIFVDSADSHLKAKDGAGTVKCLASALPDTARFVPTTGQSIAMTADANIIDPAGGLAALTVTLPLLVHGQMISMTFSQAITALTITPNGANGSLANAITAATAGQVVRLRYNASANKLFAA